MLLLLACVSTLSIENKDSKQKNPDSGDGLDTLEQPPQGSCQPGAEAVFGEEGHALNASLHCLGSGKADRITLSNLPEGASYDEESRVLSWTPSMDQAGYYELPALAEGPDGLSNGTLSLWVADAWEAQDNVPVDPLTYTEEYGLPVLHLSRPDNTNSTDNVPAEATYRGHTYSIELQYRGAASLYYPKNSYSLSFPKDDEFSDEVTGFTKRRGIVLTSTFDDNCYFRQKMVFDLWNDLDPSHAQIQTRFVVVYINGAYEGLYMLGDHIDGEYWEDNGHFEDGNLYKSVDHSANFYADYYGSPKSSLHSGYEKKEGTPLDGEAGAYDDLEALITFVISADEATFRSEIGQQIELNEFMDWWILVRYTEADDSGGKNAYLYNDPAAPRWHYAPWDFNHSLGQTWQTERESVRTNGDFTGANNLFRRLLEDPVLGPQLVARYQAALAGPYSEAALQAHIDAYVAEMWPSALRDWEKWGTQYQSYGGWSWRSDWTTPEEEVQYVRDWVSGRTVFMEGLYP